MRSSLQDVGQRPSETFRWIIKPATNAPRCKVYTDSSATDPRFIETRRIGWAMVGIDGEGNFVMVASGVAPDWVTDIVGGEAWALVQAAAEWAPGSSGITDSLVNVLMIEKGVAGIQECQV